MRRSKRLSNLPPRGTRADAAVDSDHAVRGGYDAPSPQSGALLDAEHGGTAAAAAAALMLNE